ncbi:hypothetical protein N658DRAFT_3294 [Parathielavia hyrcaniae]|uniref:Uncharacterized protein n=1 Tax=Parathielavia hyrcaniae TaxID=113614 RepID=A0AAN6T6F8_9PEZI|nr:hypothetical protein N658DRAFT_3294 [Parathielavia hyrcaniae]
MLPCGALPVVLWDFQHMGILSQSHCHVGCGCPCQVIRYVGIYSPPPPPQGGLRPQHGTQCPPCGFLFIFLFAHPHFVISPLPLLPLPLQTGPIVDATIARYSRGRRQPATIAEARTCS